MDRVSPAYGAWQDALAAEFFGSAHAGAPVVFYVDDEIAQEIAQRYGIDTPLAAAVRRHLRPAERVHMFGAIHGLAATRHSRDHPPPTLPLLAVTVLAATHMAANSSQMVTNYYTPLARLLFGSSASENIRGAVQQSFRQVAELWRGLDKWLSQSHGAQGISTITAVDSGMGSLIGYPMSQALMRRSDRMTLTQFFHDIGFQKSTKIDADYLFRTLKVWCQRRNHGLSKRFQAALQDPSDQELLLELLARLAAAWDGRVLDSTSGHRLIKLQITFVPMPMRMRWAAEISSGVSSGKFFDAENKVHPFSRGIGSHYEGLDRLPFLTSSLLNGHRFRGESDTGIPLIFQYQTDDILLFREDPDLGCWVSQSSVVPHEEHLLLTSATTSQEVESVLRAASPGWTPVKTDRIPTLAAHGWRMYRKVRFDDGAQLTNALRGRHRAVQLLRPVPVSKPRLVGGLPVARGLSHHHYLQNGAPDLLLSAGEGKDRKVDITFDGLKRRPIVATGFPTLLNQELFTPGDHVLTADGVSLQVSIVDRFAGESQPNGTGSVGFSSVEQASTTASVLPKGASGVRGASLPESTAASIILAKRGALWTGLASASGSLSEVALPDRPAWLAARMDMNDDPYYFEVEVPREWSGWLLQQSAKRWTIQPVNPQVADLEIVRTAKDPARWAEAVLEADPFCSDPRWAAYRLVAEKILG